MPDIWTAALNVLLLIDHLQDVSL